MVDESGGPTQLTPYEKEQARLRREAIERKQKVEDLKQQILIERGPDYEWQAQVRGIDDPQQLRAIVEIAAEGKARQLSQPGTVFSHDDRGLLDSAIEKEAAKRQQAEAEQHQAQAQPQPQSATDVAQQAIEFERSKVAAAEELKRQELQKQKQQKQEAQKREAQESARREPIPNVVQRFNAILAESKAQKAQTNEAAIERLAERAPYRPDYARHDSLKDWSLGEISDAKAERLSRMFNKPLGDKGFDPTDPPTHTRPTGRGGR